MNLLIDVGTYEITDDNKKYLKMKLILIKQISVRNSCFKREENH